MYVSHNPDIFSVETSTAHCGPNAVSVICLKGCWSTIWCLHGYNAGSTTIALTSRIDRRTVESPVVEHFNSDEDTLADMTVVAINQIHSHNPCLHKIGESRWIRTLGTSYPSGMNLRANSLWNLFNDHPRWLEVSCAPFWQRGYWIYNIPRTDTLMYV